MESKLILVGRSSIPEDDERGYLGHDQVAINIASVGETIDEKVCQQRVGPCAVILVRETDSFLCVKQERTSLRSPGRFSSRYRRRRGGEVIVNLPDTVIPILLKQSLPIH